MDVASRERNQQAWKAGDTCYYAYKGPHGMSSPEFFRGKVVGFTKKRIRIKAYDPHFKYWFKATVRPGSLYSPTKQQEQR